MARKTDGPVDICVNSRSVSSWQAKAASDTHSPPTPSASWAFTITSLFDPNHSPLRWALVSSLYRWAHWGSARLKVLPWVLERAGAQSSCLMSLFCWAHLQFNRIFLIREHSQVILKVRMEMKISCARNFSQEIGTHISPSGIILTCNPILGLLKNKTKQQINKQTPYPDRLITKFYHILKELKSTILKKTILE